MLYNELPITFPWYEKIEQQERYKENVAPICDFRLICPRDGLLPFELTRPASGQSPLKWSIYEANSRSMIQSLTACIPQLKPFDVDDLEYYIYDGAPLVITGHTINLPPGFYYSELLWPDGTFRFSEMFFVPDVDSFNSSNEDVANFLKLEWWNGSDIDPLLYSVQDVDGNPFFKNRVYLDTFITNSEPAVTVDGTKDGDDETIPTFQKVVVSYRITVPVPDFMKKAIMIGTIHDHFVITTQRGVRSGEVRNIVVTTDLEGNGGVSIIDIVFDELILLNKGCGANLTATAAVLT